MIIYLIGSLAIFLKKTSIGCNLYLILMSLRYITCKEQNNIMIDKQIELCKRQDRKAQYTVYKQYAKAMFNVALRILNNQEEAEDVLQEAFVKAFKNIEKFEGKSTFGAWLKRIVVNHAINQLKSKKIDIVPIDEASENIDINDYYSNRTFDDHYVDQLKIEEIRNAIKLLPNGFRVVFSLYLLEGYDHKEIASILEISESTSKSQYNRAKKKLRQILDERRFELSNFS